MKVIKFQDLSFSVFFFFFFFFVGWVHDGSNLALGAGEILKISLFLPWLFSPKGQINDPIFFLNSITNIPKACINIRYYWPS